LPVLKVQRADGTYDIIQTSGLSGSEIIVSATQPAGVPDGALWLDTSDNEFQGTIYDDIFDSLNNKPDRLTTVETVNVGSGGDFATINEAIAYATTKYPQYVVGATKAEFVINLLSGFVMAEQVIVKGLNLGWIRIQGEDAETVIQRSALTEGLVPVTSAQPTFGSLNGTLPIIGQLFIMDSSGTADIQSGIILANSSATIANGAGIKNAPWNGLSANYSSKVSAVASIFTGAGQYGVHSSSGSIIYLANANAQRGASPSPTDIFVAAGGFVSAQGATGGLSQTKNTLTANGIIFQP